MTTSAELQRLIARSVEDPRLEPEFLRALLDADLYVQLPLSDDAARLRLICFTRPDGLTVIPVFSDADRARVAAQNAARVAVVPGRELFASAPGATWMLDPNDTSTTLYPEEIRALLEQGTAAIAPASFRGQAMAISPALAEDLWLGELVAGAVAPIAAAQAVHLACGHAAGSVEPTALMAMVAVPPAFAERVARAVALALDASSRKPRLAVDLGTYDPAEPPEWVDDAEFAPVWQRGRVPGSAEH